MTTDDVNAKSSCPNFLKMYKKESTSKKAIAYFCFQKLETCILVQNESRFRLKEKILLVSEKKCSKGTYIMWDRIVQLDLTDSCCHDGSSQKFEIGTWTKAVHPFWMYCLKFFCE